ncbi:hypothetical protein ACF0H5_011407 [Mactra antiquata]
MIVEASAQLMETLNSCDELLVSAVLKTKVVSILAVMRMNYRIVVKVTVYFKRDVGFQTMRKTFVLSLLPAEDILSGLDRIERKNHNETLVQYFRYIRSTLIDGDILPVENWSVYGE